MDKKRAAENSTQYEAWYSIDGPDNDVILSTRASLIRNLANFPFVHHLSVEDKQRIQSIIFDACNTLEHRDRYQSLIISGLDTLAYQILFERGILSSHARMAKTAALLVRGDGKISASINVRDHLELSALGAGSNLHELFLQVKEFDTVLQQKIQFAASVDFGYLNTDIRNLGTGLKLSAFIHIPAVSFFHKTEQSLQNLFTELTKYNCDYAACFGRISRIDETVFPILGSCYKISNSMSFNGNEEIQLKNFKEELEMITEVERYFRHKMIEEHETILKDFVFKSLAQIRFSKFLTADEGIEYLFFIKLGIDAGILIGSDDTMLFDLFYRIQDGHLGFINQNEKFRFEDDVIEYTHKIKRLRAFIMQEALSAITIKN